MTKGDMYAQNVLSKILEEGTWDENPRPHYNDIIIPDENWFLSNDGTTIYRCSDNCNSDVLKRIPVAPNQKVTADDEGRCVIETPAHTKFINFVTQSYDYQKNESPIWTIRPIAWKSAVKEILWIYQMQSNSIDDLHDLGINYWDDWNVGDNTIGCRYGATVKRHDLMNRLLDGLINDPFGRRHILSLWQEDDFDDATGGTTEGLNPCCFMTMWNVRKVDGAMYLDMTLVQRSSDYATSVSINELQYQALLLMVARHCGYEPGVMNHVIQNVQIYDRHIENAKELVKRKPVDTVLCRLVLDTDKTNFYDFTIDDFKMENYPLNEIKEKNPQMKFDLGI